MNLIACLLLASLALPAPQEKPAPKPIKVGMSAALSGPAQDLGLRMQAGIRACFERVDRAGGVHGRPIEFVALDDGYVPEAAERNARVLIDDEQVLALIGNVGTPTARVTIPIVTEKKTVLFAAFTGADLLRQSPPNRYVVNFRASYAQETAVMVEGLLARGVLPYEIAVFSQNDAYGDSGFQGVARSLAAAGYQHTDRIPHGRYERNTEDVEAGVLKIVEAPVRPKAIVLVGTYAACAKFIRIVKRALPRAIYLNVSFVGSDALLQELGELAEGVIVTQVVPHFDGELPIVREYRRDLAALAPGLRPCFVSLEGYIAASMFVEALRRAGPDPTRESIIDALLDLRGLDLGLGIPIGFSAGSQQACDTVWPTVVRGGRFVQLDWKDGK